MAKKVAFAGEGSPNQPLKTWPRSGLRQTSQSGSFIVQGPPGFEDDASRSAAITGIFYGSVDIQTIATGELLDALLKFLEDENPETPGPTELWMVLNMLLRSPSALGSIPPEYAPQILEFAQRDFSRFKPRDGSVDVLDSRVVAQVLRVVDVLFSIAWFETQLPQNAVIELLRECISVMSCQASSKSLVGAAIHVVNHHHGGTPVDLVPELLRALSVGRPFASGTLLGESLNTYQSLLQSPSSRSVMLGHARLWVPPAVRALVSNSSYARQQALALFTIVNTNSLRVGEAVAETLDSPATVFGVVDEALAPVFGRRILQLLGMVGEARFAMQAWSSLLLAVSYVQPAWPGLSKWLDVAKTGIHLSPHARDAVLEAWRTVVYLFAFPRGAQSHSQSHQVNGLLQPFRSLKTATGTAKPYLQLLNAFLYVALRVSGMAVPTIWESMVAPVLRLFLGENRDPSVRMQAVEWFAELAGASPIAEPGKRERVLSVDHLDFTSEVGGLPHRDMFGRFLSFVQTLQYVEEPELLALWRAVVGVAQRALSQEMHESEASLGRIAALTNWTQKLGHRQLAAIMIENLGVQALSPQRFKASPRIVVAERGAGTTTALTALVGVFLKSSSSEEPTGNHNNELLLISNNHLEPVSEAATLQTLLAYCRNARQTVLMLRSIFAVAADRSEGTWYECTGMLLNLMASPSSGHIIEDQPHIITDALTAALAMPELPSRLETWERWARLFETVVPVMGEEYLMSILDRVPGIAALALLPLKGSGKVLNSRDAFDLSLVRIAVDSPIKNFEQVDGLPRAFTLALARSMLLRNTASNPADYEQTARRALDLIGKAEHGPNADVVLEALRSAPPPQKHVCIELWNEFFGPKSSLRRSVTEGAMEQWQRLSASLPGLGRPKRVPPKRTAKKRAVKSAEPDHPELSPRAKRMRSRQGLRGSPGLDSDPEDNYGVTSPPPSDQADDLCSSPPRAPTQAEIEQLRTLKRSLIGLNIHGLPVALRALKRSECELMQHLLSESLAELQNHLSITPETS